MARFVEAWPACAAGRRVHACGAADGSHIRTDLQSLPDWMRTSASLSRCERWLWPLRSRGLCACHGPWAWSWTLTGRAPDMRMPCRGISHQSTRTI